RTADATSSSPPPSGAAGVKPLLIEFYLPCSRICETQVGQPPSIDDNNGCSKGLRSNSFTGSLAPSNSDLRADRTTSYPFHPSGCARAHGNSFDHLVGAGEQPVGHGEAQRPGGVEVNN